MVLNYVIRTSRVEIVLLLFIFCPHDFNIDKAFQTDCVFRSFVSVPSWRWRSATEVDDTTTRRISLLFLFGFAFCNSLRTSMKRVVTRTRLITVAFLEALIKKKTKKQKANQGQIKIYGRYTMCNYHSFRLYSACLLCTYYIY